MENDFKHGLFNTVRGLLSGLLVGLVITFFANAVAFATGFNAEHRYLILLIPLGALLTCFLFRKFGKAYKAVTTIAIDRINEGVSTMASSQNREVSPKMGVIAFLNGMISHFLGASVGKEGVGVQLGLATSEILDIGERRFLGSDNSDTYLMCGASAAFSTLFSAPIAGTLFGINFASPTRTRLDSFLPCVASSFSSTMLAQALGIHILHIPAFTPMEFNVRNAIIIFISSLIIGLVTRLAVYLFEFFKELPLKHLPGNDYMKVLYPAIAFTLASFILYAIRGDFDYNGLGGNLIGEAIMGERGIADFLLKTFMIFLCLSAGFQGGEVVPLLILGSTLASPFASILGVPTGAFAALSGIAMLSGGTNLPLVCFALGMELFGYSEPGLLFIACIASFVASGRHGIYSHQNM